MTTPEKIGKYQIESVLGKGAMGVVYKAYDPDIQQTVAIKTIQKELLNLEEKDCQARLERFKQEVIAGRRLKHPNIVAIYEYGRDEETCYIVMELVRGKQLKDYFSEGYRFTLGEIIAIMLQLLDALDYAHQHGVIHRDIKPGNIMLTEGVQIQVTDFGIAKIDDSSLTKTGMVLGTPSYMAPEQCMGQHVDARTDIFSAGVVLYQFLTGEKPFGGDSPLTTMHQVLNITPVNPSRLNVHVPKAMDDIVQKALAKRPDERFQSAREFAEALRTVHASIKSVKHEATTPSLEQETLELEGSFDEDARTLTAEELSQCFNPADQTTPASAYKPSKVALEPTQRWFGKYKGWLISAASIAALGITVTTSPYLTRYLSDDICESGFAEIVKHPPEQVYECASQLYNKNDKNQLQTALKLWVDAAHHGHGPSEFALGKLHDPVLWNKIPSPISNWDAHQAEKWYKLANSHGVKEADISLQKLESWKHEHEELSKRSKSGYLSITSTPEEAIVLLKDRSFIGVTPTRVDLPSGRYELIFKKNGYRDYETAIDVKPETDIPLNAVLMQDQSHAPWADF